MNPVVTVLLPAYNSDAYIDRTIWSIRNQTLKNFKLLIIDDGATDQTGEIAARHAGEDERIQLLRRENRGLVATLNQGLSMIDSPYVARMDGDDMALPHRLERQVAYMQEHPDCVCLGSWVETIDGASRPIRVLPTPVEHHEIDRFQSEGHTSIIHPTAMMRMSAVNALGGYNEEMVCAEDLDLWLRMAEMGELHNLPLPLLQYRVHAQSMSSAFPAQQMEAVRRACAAAWKRRNTSGKVGVLNHWRPGNDIESRLKFALDTGWCAFIHGHRRTAVVYGAKSIAMKPWSIASWKLLACATLKPLPEPVEYCPTTLKSL